MVISHKTELMLKISHAGGEGEEMEKLRADTAAYYEAGGSTGISHVRDKGDTNTTDEKVQEAESSDDADKEEHV